MATPVISYPGAKWKFYKHMVEYFPTDMEVFIEPFLGGGSVSLSVADDPRFTKLKRMIAGDLAPEMWAFWTGVKQNPEQVYEIASKWFKDSCPSQERVYGTGINASLVKKYNLEESGEKVLEPLTKSERDIITDNLANYEQAVEEVVKFWNWTQSVDTSNMTIPERAARILLVNKLSFSGMGDSGSLSKDQFCDFHESKLEKVFESSKLLQRIEIYNVSFEETMKYAYENPSGTYIFLDPPYFSQEKSGLYGRNGDTHKGFPHQKFAEVTLSMPCKWFVTYDDSVAVRRMFSGKTAQGRECNIVPFKLEGGYTMAGKTSEDALDGEELFIMNYGYEDEEEDIDF